MALATLQHETNKMCIFTADSELHHTGSNTSINSTSSLNSTKSSIDNAPIYFSVGGSPEEDMAYLSNNGWVPLVLNKYSHKFLDR